MAAPELAIAKAALSATLFRADPSSLTRPAVEAFFPLLDAATTQCSRPNVQKCRAWIVEYIAPSSKRAAALGRYLIPFAKNLEVSSGQRPSLKRRRLYLLYVLSDALHHTVAKQQDRNLEQALQTHFPSLFAQAAAFTNCPKHAKKLVKLVELWEQKAYVAPTLIPRLREALSGNAPSSDTQHQQIAAGATSLRIAKDAPFVLPSQHGDASTPWFDLPASTWLPHLTPNSTRPMLPDLIQPIQLASGPADNILTEAVQALLSDVERIFSKGKGWQRGADADAHQLDTNPLGEMILIDEATGDIVAEETYYGWSRQFCEKMKERKRKTKLGKGNMGRPRSASMSDESRGRSRSPSAPANKRRRRSSSVSSPGSRQRALNRRFRSSSRSRSRSRNYDDRRQSPGRRYAPNDPEPFRHQDNIQPPVPPSQPHRFPPVPPPGSFPPPPPPPAGYQGPWPPPPPPPLGPGGPMPQWFPAPGFMPPSTGGWNQNSHPPPPPPQQHGWGHNPYRGHGGREHGNAARDHHQGGRGW